MEATANSALTQALVQVRPELLENLLADYSKRNFQVRLWDGRTWGSDQHPRFTLVLKHPGALRDMFFLPSELTLGEAYIFDDFDIEGDIEAALDLADYLLEQSDRRGVLQSLRLPTLLQNLALNRQTNRVHRAPTLHGSVHSKKRDCQAVRYHYDLPPEFFALWLDPRMLYSCAYFAPGEEPDLDTAQCRKLDYICRKLRLRRGDRLLDIGCGWGGLMIHAAARYGAQVLGISLSPRQAEVARQRIRDSGLNDRCRVEVCDYRDLELGHQVDKIVSVGMYEHVGEEQLPEYFSRAWELLRPGGAFMNTGIAVSATYKRQGPSFIDRYVFPDGELVPINTSLGAAERSGFEVRDVESLREHYALTLHHWVRRLEAHAEEARRITDDTTFRIWRLYMAASAHGFRSNRLNLYQVLLAKPLHGESGMPLTRADWYRD
ncbi:MAG: cyclopropane-fatty-acyl-phospholipid synthase family protein [Terriglobales bacterium]|jgi:cyclopropane-fatty-acyl-phospholipid synthase